MKNLTRRTALAAVPALAAATTMAGTARASASPTVVPDANSGVFLTDVTGGVSEPVYVTACARSRRMRLTSRQMLSA
jgi:hypothetical protein